jgi:hypothetical protein
MSERLARAKAAADKFIAACVAPGTLKGYKKEWVKWLTHADGSLQRRGGNMSTAARNSGRI